MKRTSLFFESQYAFVPTVDLEEMSKNSNLTMHDCRDLFLEVMMRARKFVTLNFQSQKIYMSFINPYGFIQLQTTLDNEPSINSLIFAIHCSITELIIDQPIYEEYFNIKKESWKGFIKPNKTMKICTMMIYYYLIFF